MRKTQAQQSNKTQPSLFFDQWAENHDIKDDEGDTAVLYHGTTHPFDSFDYRSHTSPESYYGSGFYFSNSQIDASENYAGEGPDLTSRIENEADNLQNSLEEDPEETYETYGAKYPHHFKMNVEGEPEFDAYALAKEIAKENLFGGAPQVIPTYLKMKNPLSLTPQDSPYYEHQYKNNGADPDDDDDFDNLEYDENSPVMHLHDAILNAAADFDADGEGIWNNLDEVVSFHDGVSANAVFTELRKIIDEKMPEDDSGELIPTGEFLGRIIQKMGHDGIIMNAYSAFGPSNRRKGMPHVTPDTKHYIVWNGNQAKSAMGNSGLYDPENKNLTAEKNLPQIRRWAQRLGRHAACLFLTRWAQELDENSLPESADTAIWLANRI